MSENTKLRGACVRDATVSPAKSVPMHWPGAAEVVVAAERDGVRGCEPCDPEGVLEPLVLPDLLWLADPLGVAVSELAKLRLELSVTLENDWDDGGVMSEAKLRPR